MSQFNVTFETNTGLFDLTFANSSEFNAEMTTVVQVLPDAYDGQYEVTPLLFQDIVLPTNGKNMQDDITVKEIPYWETSNPSGGTTVYIAMEE